MCRCWVALSQKMKKKRPHLATTEARLNGFDDENRRIEVKTAV